MTARVGLRQSSFPISEVENANHCGHFKESVSYGAWSIGGTQKLLIHNHLQSVIVRPWTAVYWASVISSSPWRRRRLSQREAGAVVKAWHHFGCHHLLAGMGCQVSPWPSPSILIWHKDANKDTGQGWRGSYKNIFRNPLGTGVGRGQTAIIFNLSREPWL